MNALRAIDEWGARTVAAGVTRADAEVDAYGPRDTSLPWASVTKLLTGVAVLVAIEEGTVDLDEAAGPEGSTLRHLLAHASGLPPDDGPPLMPPGKRRIYSNVGIERAAALVAERADMSFADYFGEVALAMDVPRTATVTAISPAVVASCDRKTFDEFLRPLFADDD